MYLYVHVSICNSRQRGLQVLTSISTFYYLQTLQDNYLFSYFKPFIITIHSTLLYSKNPFKSFIFIHYSFSQTMMHRSSQGQHVMGHCSCGMFHGQNNSFSMLFSTPYDEPETYCFTPNSSSSSSVDCTLSLGTPSTRFTEDEEKRSRHHERRSVKNFCWDLLTPKQYNCTQSQTKATRASTNNNNNSNNDSLLARRCANCDTTSTPLWRNGPRGPKVKKKTLNI